jgi:hypothetical protein
MTPRQKFMIPRLARSVAGSRDLQRIAGAVVPDLEAKKLVHRGDRGRIGRADPNLSPAGHIPENVADRLPLLRHHRHARRYAIVNEHWRRKISIGEHRGHMSEMHSNRVAAAEIRGILCRHLDDSAVTAEKEVMSRFAMIESHRMVAADIDAGRVILAGASSGGGAGTDGKSRSRQQDDHSVGHPSAGRAPPGLQRYDPERKEAHRSTSPASDSIATTRDPQAPFPRT